MNTIMGLIRTAFETTNTFRPMGGVTIPVSASSTMKMPNQTGS